MIDTYQSFYYRGGLYSRGEDGWSYYQPTLSGGGMAPAANISYDALHQEGYHYDQQGNLRNNDGDLIKTRAQMENEIINHETQAYANLTEAEKALVRRHPGPALSVLCNMEQAFAVTQQFFPNILNAHNNAADAFRHAYFSALNTSAIGHELAYQFGVAHETWPGNPVIERAMDLTNNVFGINTVMQHPCWSSQEIATYIYNSVAIGKLIMIQNGRLVPTSIP